MLEQRNMSRRAVLMFLQCGDGIPKAGDLGFSGSPRIASLLIHALFDHLSQHFYCTRSQCPV
jgi:hypothetical protein